jgi:hypothetical protein
MSYPVANVGMKTMDRSRAVRAFTAPEGARIEAGTMIPGRSAALVAHLTNVERAEFGRPRGARGVDVVALTRSEALLAERTIAADSGALRGVSVSPCGQRFAVRGEIGEPTALRWIDGREQGFALQDEGVFALASATSAVVGRYSATQLASVDLETQMATPLEECKDAVFEGVATSPDREWVIAVAMRSKAVQIWRRSTGARSRRLSPSRVLVLGAPTPAFSPDSALVACGASMKVGRSIRYAVELFDVGEQWPARATLELGEGHLDSMVFSRAGRRILTAQHAVRRADIKVWDRDTATLLYDIQLAETPQERPVVGFVGTSDDDSVTYIAVAGDRSIWSFETP